MFYAHSGEVWEPLAEHLRDVAERAAAFASVFSAAEEARLVGLLHDLGKYSEVFSRRLAGQESGLDHWSAGAWAALTHFREVSSIFRPTSAPPTGNGCSPGSAATSRKGSSAC